MQKKKAVLFDLDGTVLDTIADIAAALNRALAAFGFKEKSVSQVQSYLGNGMLMLVRRATDFAAEDSMCLQIREAFAKEYANDMYSNTVPYQGVPQLLCDLGAAGVK
ncbi:MAG: HAD hydrolase-like protein, partial [Clostridia bacterium]|nr:HAD hydrolase-like protein [Clostridia bacterium]